MGAAQSLLIFFPALIIQFLNIKCQSGKCDPIKLHDFVAANYVRSSADNKICNFDSSDFQKTCSSQTNTESAMLSNTPKPSFIQRRVFDSAAQIKRSILEAGLLGQKGAKQTADMAFFKRSSLWRT